MHSLETTSCLIIDLLTPHHILVIEVLCLRRDVPAVFVMQANVPLHVEDPEAVDDQNSSRMPHNTITTSTQKYSYNYVMRQQIPNDNKMFIYIHDGPMTIVKRTGGAVFCDTALKSFFIR